MSDFIDGSAVIEFKNISKKYGDFIALNHISMKIQRGEFITVIGSSGCGKTTMLRMINGLLTPDEGSVWINGEDISTVDQIELRRHIGYVIQSISLFPHLSVKKNIEFVPNILKYEKNKMKEISKNLIHVVGLEPEILDRYPSELSGGQKQRVGVARALAASPDILLMDEPFGALDEITRSKLQDELLNIQKKLGITTVFITHDLREAAKLGDRIFIMNRGNIERIGTSEEILKSFKDGSIRFSAS